MIPLHLTLKGFLSYHEAVELDFSQFDLACIAGPNGAGKSSLLDAITWALFGQARKRDDSLINLHPEVKAAEVCFIFAYENNIFRVQRTSPRGKATLLEFHILQDGKDLRAENGQLNPNGYLSAQAKWKPLTERSLRETQAHIESTLRLDYETFVNASFFLQGKADQFTQQRPGDRKRILGSILGLEVWEAYRLRAAERRKTVESEITTLDGRLEEINKELGEETTRRAALKTLEEELARLAQAHSMQEALLENIRKVAAALAERRRWVETLDRGLDSARKTYTELATRLVARQNDRQTFNQILERAEAIESAYRAWQQARADIEYWDAVAQRFREQEKLRQGPLDEINTTRTRLEAELANLQGERDKVIAAAGEMEQLEAQLSQAQAALAKAEARLAQRANLSAELQDAQQAQAELKSENGRLKAEMDELVKRIATLKETEGAACPLCGQPMSAHERGRLVAELQTKGAEMGDRYRTNLTAGREQADAEQNLKNQIAGLAAVEQESRVQARVVDQASHLLQQIQEQQAAWERAGAPRLAVLAQELEKESFALPARQRLAEIDAGLKAIGYDAAAHDAARKSEAKGRPADAEMLALEKARAALAPLEREINELAIQVKAQRAEVERQQQEYESAAAALEKDLKEAPDLEKAEQDWLYIQEQENRARMEYGAAQQRVSVLAELKERRKRLEAQREEKARLAGQYRQLERALGKDGVPSLLIEQALPQIENKANEILERLSGGGMSVRFLTQAAYKDKKREDLKETLDILISDSAGTRDYEMFSGGESFRVNFAIRLALSEVLAQRSGARLQTLVIDEGFGSQDTLGRQRLIEAINLVRRDFAKILVITHIDELKDAFPNRIEVEKTAHGSSLRVV